MGRLPSIPPPKMPPDLVVRPSGVWNSRAPFHNLWLAHQQQNRSHHLLTLAVLRTQSDAAKPANAAVALRRFFRTRAIGLIAENALLSYRMSQRILEGGARFEPSVADVETDLQLILYELRQASAIRYVALFETFALCWALNFLLAKLEAGTPWSEDERRLAVLLSPLHSKTPPPGWPLVAKHIPLVANGLHQLPHVIRDPTTRREIEQPISPELNAFTAMQFWRDFRNLVVHRGNVINLAFVTKYQSLYEEIRAPFATMSRPLVRGEALHFPEAVVRSIMSTHYRAARWMNDLLLSISEERRGHALAPQAQSTSGPFVVVKRAAPLLIVGDHAPSVEMFQTLPGADVATQGSYAV